MSETRRTLLKQHVNKLSFKALFKEIWDMIRKQNSRNKNKVNVFILHLLTATTVP